MPRAVLIVVIVFATVFAASLGMLLAFRKAGNAGPGGNSMSGMGPGGTSSQRSADPVLPDDNVKDLKILPFELTDSNGVKFDQSVFTGKLTVLNFMFTHCTLVCPVLTQTVGDVAKRLTERGGAAKYVDVLSISVDPEHDTPARLAEYAKIHNASPTQWRFAVGPRETVYPMLEQGLKFAVGTDPSAANLITLPDGSTMNNILHPSWVVLVGPKGEVLGVYLSAIPDEMTALVDRAAKAAEKLKLKD